MNLQKPLIVYVNMQKLRCVLALYVLRWNYFLIPSQNNAAAYNLLFPFLLKIFHISKLTSLIFNYYHIFVSKRSCNFLQFNDKSLVVSTIYLFFSLFNAVSVITEHFCNFVLFYSFLAGVIYKIFNKW